MSYYVFWVRDMCMVCCCTEVGGWKEGLITIEVFGGTGEVGLVGLRGLKGGGGGPDIGVKKIVDFMGFWWGITLLTDVSVYEYLLRGD